MREESESGIRKSEARWFKMREEYGEVGAMTCDGRLFHRQRIMQQETMSL